MSAEQNPILQSFVVLVILFLLSKIRPADWFAFDATEPDVSPDIARELAGIAEAIAHRRTDPSTDG